MHKDYNVETEVNFFGGKQRGKFFGFFIDDVFHWFGCLLTRQAKSPMAQGTCQSIHISHEKVFCIISFGNVLKTLDRAWGNPHPPEINNASPP